MKGGNIISASGGGSGLPSPVTANYVLIADASGVPTWSRLSNIHLNGSTIQNSRLAVVPSSTIKGNNTGSSSNPIDLTAAQVAAMLPVFTDASNGLVPASGGESDAFLRADGAWLALSRNIRGGRPGDSYTGGLTINGGAPGE
jgi:hypothetical protein